jgi:hypothetical protein
MVATTHPCLAITIKRAKLTHAFARQKRVSPHRASFAADDPIVMAEYRPYLQISVASQFINHFNGYSMSSESTIVFYGIRLEISDGELDSLEERTHPLLVTARQNGLKHYWGNFALKGSKYVLLIGDRLGVFGLENEKSLQISLPELATRAAETDDRLQRCGITEPARLLLEWQPDE